MRQFMLVLGLLLGSNLEAQQILRICGDDGQFPPYTYNDAADGGRLKGATVDILMAVFKGTDYQPVIDLLPWKRALQEADSGQIYALVIDATANDERRKTYLLTDPLYQIHSALYYDPAHFPQPPRLEGPADLKKYQYGGIFSYNYAMYDIPHQNINVDAKNEVSRFAMLRLHRFDFALADVEVLQGFVMTKQLDLTGLKYLPVPGFAAKPYYALISRHRPDAEQLRRLINQGLAALHQNGGYAQILAKYGLQASGL